MSASPALVAALMARAPRDFDLDFRRGIYRRNGLAIPQLIGVGGISYSQSGSCWEIGADGSLVQFASNQARVLPGLGLWARSGFTNRADISASKTAWTGNSNTVPASLDNQGLAPDGSNSAWMIPAEAVGGPRNQRNYTIPADTSTYAWSVFVKALEPGATVRFANNGVHPSRLSSAVFNFADLSFSGASNGTVTPVANGWYRLGQSFTNPGTDTTFLMAMEALASTAGKVLFWGATFGIGTSPAPYIPSPTTADVSNGPSVMTLPFIQRDLDFAMLVGFNSAQGPTATGRTCLSIGDGSSRNRIRLGLYPGTGTSYVEVRAGDVGLLTAGVPGGRVFGAERGVIGLRRRGGRYSLGESFTGSIPSFSAEFSAMALPAGISAMDIGHTITASQFNGIIERVRVLEGTFSDSDFAGLIAELAA